MRTFSPSAIASVALAAAFLAAPSDSSAQETPGVARISDTLRPVPEPNPLPVTTVGSSRTRYLDGGVAGPGCQPGDGNIVVGGEQRYPEQYMNHRWFRPGVYRQRLRWDYIRGPAIHAIVREPVVYSRWLPEIWYGDPRFGIPEGVPVPPMIYMPTDTTQLGYYYQRVPTWVPKPHIIPPSPLPSNFHRIDRPATVIGGAGFGGHCEGGIDGAIGCPVDATPSYPTPAHSAPAPNVQPGVPPKPGV